MPRRKHHWRRELPLALAYHRSCRACPIFFGQRAKSRRPHLSLDGVIGRALSSPNNSEREKPMLDTHAALIYTMVLASAADEEMNDREIRMMSEIIRLLPVFQGFDFEQLSKTTRDCVELLQDPEGLDRALDAVKAALPASLRQTDYALACDVVAADGSASQEELRFLEIFRHHMDVDRLEAAAIERGARARFRVA